jgi:uncharacterized protein YdhG (YjbR/CyaY superfamily)
MNSITDYIQASSIGIQPILSELRTVIQKAAPKATEKISWGMPTFYLNGNLVHFAAHKNHIGFYPAPSAITRFARDLKKYKTSKGAVQFPLTQPLPTNLIVKIVEFRVNENLQKPSKNKKANTPLPS